MNTSNTYPIHIMPPAPQLINSSSIFYRDSHSPVQQSLPIVWENYGDSGDDATMVSSETTETDSHTSNCRSSRIEFAIFLKVLLKLVDQEIHVKSQAKTIIASCLRKVKQTNMSNATHRSILLSLEDVELPLRCLVGESVWVCAYHYTTLYQQRRHRPSRIFGANMTFKRESSDIAPLSAASTIDGCSSASSSSGSETTYEQQSLVYETFEDFPSTVSFSDNSDDGETLEILDEIQPNPSLNITTGVDMEEASYIDFLRDAF